MTGIGHNRAPVVESVTSDIRDVLADLDERRDAFRTSAARFVVRGRFDVADAGDILKLARRFREHVEEKRLEITRPLDDARDAAIGAVDEFWRETAAELEALQGRVDAWLDGEKARAAAQKAEQEAALAARRQEALGPEAPPPAVETLMKPMRGDLGARVTPRERITAIEIEDITKIPDLIMGSQKVRDAIAAVARDLLKHTDTIPGLRVTRGIKGQVS